jgi:hypothetical protein
MALGGSVGLLQLIVIFVLLFVAVWIPCCLSDIVFPLFFSDKGKVHDHHHGHQTA